MRQRRVSSQARLVCDPTKVSIFSSSSPHNVLLRRQERASPPCEARSKAGLYWRPSPPSSTASQACPSPQQGNVTWQCGRWGVWDQHGPSFASCANPPTLEDHLANIATAPNTAVVLEVAPLSCFQRFSVAGGKRRAELLLLRAHVNGHPHPGRLPQRRLHPAGGGDRGSSSSGKSRTERTVLESFRANGGSARLEA